MTCSWLIPPHIMGASPSPYSFSLRNVVMALSDPRGPIHCGGGTGLGLQLVLQPALGAFATLGAEQGRGGEAGSAGGG